MDVTKCTHVPRFLQLVDLICNSELQKSLYGIRTGTLACLPSLPRNYPASSAEACMETASWAAWLAITTTPVMLMLRTLAVMMRINGPGAVRTCRIIGRGHHPQLVDRLDVGVFQEPQIGPRASRKTTCSRSVSSNWMETVRDIAQCWSDPHGPAHFRDVGCRSGTPREALRSTGEIDCLSA